MDNLLHLRLNDRVEGFYGVTNEFIIGSGTMQGWRPTMEDSHAILVTLPHDRSTSMFGVFDGHGGGEIAEFLSQNIYYYIISEPAFRKGYVANALINAFIRLDTILMNDPKYGKMKCGSTAVVVLVRNKKLFCANVGDSRAVAYVRGEVIPLSYDHKPSLRVENFRIIRSGHFVDYGRVNGDLAMSRAFGDFRYKRNRRKTMREQAVISEPDVVEYVITENWEFIVLACDGIWDSMTNEEVCTFVKGKIGKNVRVDMICEQLMRHCLSRDYPLPESLGADNMTVIIVVFLDNVCRPYLSADFQDRPASSINFTSPITTS